LPNVEKLNWAKNKWEPVGGEVAVGDGGNQRSAGQRRNYISARIVHQSVAQAISAACDVELHFIQHNLPCFDALGLVSLLDTQQRFQHV